MAHLNFFGVENFKVFADLHRFDLRPITILTGTNSSGKSSLTKAILLSKTGLGKIESDVEIPREEFNSILGNESFVKFHAVLHKSFGLNFYNELNIGNFQNALNYNSNNGFMLFEYPIKMPFINENFIMRFQYAQEVFGKLKSGIQKDVEIIHSESQTTVVKYDSVIEQMTINFSFLFGELVKTIEVKKKISELHKEIKLLIKDLPPNINGLSPELDILDIDNKKRIRIEEILIENDYYSKYNTSLFGSDFEGDTNSLKAKNKIYCDSQFTYIEDFTFKTILNYAFLLNNKQIEEYCILNHLPLKEFSENCRMVNEKLENISNGNVISYLLRMELKALDNLHIIGDGKPDAREERMVVDFKDCLYRIIGLEEYSDFQKNLIDLNPIFELIFDAGLIIKSNRENPSNFYKFVVNFVYNGINQGLIKIGSLNNSINYIPSVRTKINRIFRSGSESFLH